MSNRALNVADAYDRVAIAYDNFYSLPDDIQEDDEIRQFLKDWIGCFNKRTLDLGCGTGKLLELANIPAAKYAGLDISEGMLAELKSRHPDHRDLTHASFNEKWPYPDGSFGFIVSLYQSLNYALDMDFIMGEINRVLAPGGKIVLMLASEHHGGSRIIKNQGLKGEVLGHPVTSTDLMNCTSPLFHNRRGRARAIGYSMGSMNLLALANQSIFNVIVRALSGSPWWLFVAELD